MQTYRAEGRWILPGSSEYYYGVLSFDQESGAELILKDIALEKVDQIEIIHGISKNGKAITLYDCYRTSTPININSFGNYAETVFSCMYIFEGVHLKEFPSFRSVSVNLSNLAEWTEKNGISSDLYVENKTTVKCEVPEKIDLGSLSGCKYNISFSLNNKNEGTLVTKEHIIVFKAWVNIEFNEEMSFNDAFKKIRYFSSLLSFVLKKPVSIQEFHGKSEQFVSSYDNKTLETIKCYFYQAGYQKEDTLHNIDIFRYIHLSKINPRFVIKWISLYENDLFRPVFDNFISEYSTPSVYIDRKFVNYSRALEVLHRALSETKDSCCYRRKFKEIANDLLEKFSDNQDEIDFIKKQVEKKYKTPTLYQRMIELTIEYKNYLELYQIKEVHLFCRDVSGWRNSLVHGDVSVQPKIKKSLGSDISLLNRKIEALLRICLLKLIGMDEKYILEKFSIDVPEDFKKNYIHEYVESRTSDPDVKLELVKDLAYMVHRFVIVSADTINFYRSEKVSEKEADKILKYLVEIDLIEHNGQVSSGGYNHYHVRNEINKHIVEKYVEKKSM
ncbi:MAG TPA: hypothetical protein PLZ43_13340 [bacterium]|nr:hypothetical protein [bacterium]